LDNVGPNKKIHFGGSVYNYPKNISWKDQIFWKANSTLESLTTNFDKR
jgi:hypothetical protein